MRHRGIWAVVAAVVLALGAVAAVVELRPRPAESQEVAAPATASVERSDLVDTRTVDGQIGYGPATILPALLSGTATALPAAGTTLGRGQRLYALDNQPVLLLIGALPAYRDLAPGAAGRDVEQLEHNLRFLGYEDFSVDDEYTSATAEAVRDWQSDNGLVRTGVVELGRVVFWPHRLRVASVDVAPGQTIAAGDPVLSHTSANRSVHADLDVTLAALARVGADVEVALPGKAAVAGRVTAVGTTIEPPADPESGGEPAAESDPTIALTIAVSDPSALGRITGAPVEVRLAGDRRNDVLTVPVAALLALSEGGYGLEVIDGDSRRVVPVRTGLFAAGRVEISGAGIDDGTAVGTAAP